MRAARTSTPRPLFATCKMMRRRLGSQCFSVWRGRAQELGTPRIRAPHSPTLDRPRHHAPGRAPCPLAYTDVSEKAPSHSSFKNFRDQIALQPISRPRAKDKTRPVHVDLSSGHVRARAPVLGAAALGYRRARRDPRSRALSELRGHARAGPPNAKQGGGGPHWRRHYLRHRALHRPSTRTTASKHAFMVTRALRILPRCGPKTARSGDSTFLLLIHARHPSHYSVFACARNQPK